MTGISMADSETLLGGPRSSDESRRHPRRGQSRRWRLFAILQRQIMREIAIVFALVIVMVTALLQIVGVVQQGATLGLSSEILLPILPYIIPSTLPFTIPAMFLLAVTIVHGRMSSDLEVTAAKAAGINVLTLMQPSILMATMLSLATFGLTDQVIPWASQQIETNLALSAREIFLQSLRETQRFEYRPMGITVVVAGIQDDRLISPMFEMRRGQRRSHVLHAEEAKIDFDLAQREIILYIRNALCDIPGKTPNTSSRGLIEEEELRIPLVGERRRQPTHHLTGDEICDRIGDARSARGEFKDRVAIESVVALTLGDFAKLESLQQKSRQKEKTTSREINRMRTEYHSRFAISCSCFFFVLLGCPFSLIHGRGHFMADFLVCFSPIVAVYYPAVLGVVGQCRRGNLDPAWAVWIGNAMLLVAAIALIRRTIKN